MSDFPADLWYEEMMHLMFECNQCTARDDETVDDMRMKMDSVEGER